MAGRERWRERPPHGATSRGGLGAAARPSPGRRGAGVSWLLQLVGDAHVLIVYHRRGGRHGGANLRLDGLGDVGILPQVVLGVLAALAQPNIADREERAGLLDDAHLQAAVDQAALTREALVEHDVELRRA